MASLVFVGSVNADTIAVVPHLPSPDERLLADAVVHAGGGNSATAAVAAARVGGDVAFVGPVAADEQGARIREDLAREGVDVSGLVEVPAGQGGASVVLVDQSTGTRSICTRPLPPFKIPDTSPALDLMSAARWVHADHLGWAAVREWLTTFRRAGSDGDRMPRVSVDAGNPIPGFSPSGVDLYAPTVASLRRSYGELPVGDLLDRALADGAHCVVATDGGQGSYAARRPGEHVHVPAFDVEVVSTLGAGDVFHGALLVAVDRGLDLPEALRYANAVAALSCRAIDGRSGIPTHAEVTEFLAQQGAAAR